ncbi:MAG: hypothetical protein R3B47_13235 [Bacteroidia bacterium]
MNLPNPKLPAFQPTFLRLAFLFILLGPHLASAQGWAQLGADLDTTIIPGRFGKAVSASEDGSIVAVTNPDADTSRGAIKVFRLQGGSWVPMGADIVGPTRNELMGDAVQLSDNGQRLIVGSKYQSFYTPTFGIGLARVYEYQPGSNSWTQMGSTLYPDSAGANNAHFGHAVSISGDGNRVAVGALHSYSTHGHAKVYEWTGSNWQQVGASFPGLGFVPNSNAGSSVSLSRTGDMVAIGYKNAYRSLPNNNYISLGAVQVFHWNGSSWVLRGASLYGDNHRDEFGNSVSLSADGSRVAVGANSSFGSGQDSPIGYVKVFEYSQASQSWAQLGAKLRGASLDDQMGYSVSLSSNGNRLAALRSGKRSGRRRFWFGKNI